MVIFLDEQEIYRKAVETFGIEPQIDMCIEECAELIQALNKAKRCGIIDSRAVASVCEEVADVEIMLGQMRHIFDTMHGLSGFDKHNVTVWKRYKLERLQGHVESHKPHGETVTGGDIVEGTAEKFGLNP